MLFCGFFIYNSKNKFKSTDFSCIVTDEYEYKDFLSETGQDGKNIMKAEYIRINVLNTFCMDIKLGINTQSSAQMKWKVDSDVI